MICWYCYWGWSVPACEIYEEALRRLGGDSAPLKSGPAHVVWEDENFELVHVRGCLDDMAEWVRDWNDNRYTEAELSIVRWSLEQLAALPEGIREPEPEDYDGERPEAFPPTIPVRQPEDE